MARCKDWAWNAGTNTEAHSVQHAQLAVLMDLRDELKELNATLAPLRCSNFLNMPRVLSAIRKNTNKKRRKKNGA